MPSSGTYESLPSKPTHIYPGTLIEELTVEQLNNLAAAFYYFIWPSAPVDHGFTATVRDATDLNVVMESIHYARGLGMSNLQIDVFYTRVAMFARAPNTEATFWSNKHARVADEYNTQLQELLFKRAELCLSVG